MGSAASTAGAAEASVTAEALSTEAAKGLVPRGLWTEACDRRFEELSGAMPRGAAEAEWRNAEHSLRVDDIELGQKVILKALDHSALQREKMGQHLAGTRGWVFTAFDAWLLGAESAESESYDKLFWLLGGGGTGKSVAFAVQLNRLRARGAAIAWHFCRHDNAGASGVTTLIRSLAAMLCATVRGFEEMLRADLVSFFEEKGDLDGMQPAGLFELLVSKPLSKVEPPGQNCVICIDALDELPPKDLGSVLALIVDLFPALPQWVKIFLTSRDEAHIKAALSEQFTPMELKVDGSHNQEDMRAFLRHMARGFFQESLSLADVERDVEKEFEGVQMRDRLAPLAPSLMQSKAVYDDAVARIILRDTQKAYDDLCSAIPDIRPDPLLQSSKSLEALFAEAARAQDVVAAAIADAWETDAASSNVRHPKSGKRPWVESADEPGIKGMPRALEKRDKDYGGDYRRLTDLSRITLRFLDCKGLLGAFEAMRNLPQCTLLQVKNRFGSRTPLGYCDVNALFAFGVLDGDGESVQHIAEVQFNLDEIVLAKKEAHTHYEAVRSQLPDLCAGTKYLAADLEASIMKKLENSTLDAFVKVLEDKAKGLFIFAQLLNDHLARAGAGQSFAALDGVPAGLDEIYLTNFRRCCADDAEWRECAGLVALIVAAREPLSADIARGIMGVAVFAKVADKLSILFPIIDGKLSVLHKTVTDWLRRDDRAGERFFLSPDQIAEAHFKLARALEAALPSEVYAISHVVYHQVRAADASADGAEKSESLRKTLRNAAFVAQRVSLGQRADLAKDYTDALARAGKRSARALKEWSKFTPLYASFLADFPQHATSCARNFGPASTSCVAEDAAAAPASAAHWAFANTPTTTDALVTKMESGEHTRNKRRRPRHLRHGLGRAPAHRGSGGS
ncbi:hypothetical protein M885DRAFT_83226 [Pelagophyceae sp. CCMP2097]|nr:hypothetical protein M885DRAFT_83226 [Pelagophyceae sp. CCMP2097]